MTEVRVSERRGLDTGEAADGWSDARMDMAMEVATAVTYISAGTAGEAALEPMERNENGKRRRSEVEKPHGARGSAASLRTSTATPNHRENGNHAGDAHCTAGGAVVRDEIVVGGKREKAGLVSPG